MIKESLITLNFIALILKNIDISNNLKENYFLIHMKIILILVLYNYLYLTTKPSRDSLVVRYE